MIHFHTVSYFINLILIITTLSDVRKCFVILCELRSCFYLFYLFFRAEEKLLSAKNKMIPFDQSSTSSSLEIDNLRTLDSFYAIIRKLLRRKSSSPSTDSNQGFIGWCCFPWCCNRIKRNNYSLHLSPSEFFIEY